MGKVSRYFDDVKVKAFRRLYTYTKGHGELLYATGGHRAVSHVPIITIQSNNRIRGINSRVFNDYKI